MTMPFHTCSGAECPKCGVFAPDATVARFRDSRGLPVSRMPSQVAPGTTVIIVQGTYGDVGWPWQVVIHQRADNGWWGFPGGRMESGESIEACAIREIREETGLTIALHRLVAVDSDPRQYAICAYPNGDLVHYCNCTFLATVAGGTLTPSPESRQLCWASIEKLPQPFLPGHRWRLEQAMKGHDRVEVR